MTDGKQGLRSEPLRPFEAGWLESEAEQKAKSTFAHERCNLMESALRRVGFSDHSQAWVLAVLIAKISAGWEPLDRSINQLANDPEFRKKCKSDRVDIRQDTVRRALRQLQKFNLLTWEKLEGEQRRARAARNVITCDPRRLAAIAGGDFTEKAVRRGNKPEPAQPATDQQRTSNAPAFDQHLTSNGPAFDQQRTSNGPATDQQTSAPSLCIIPSPESLSPSSPSHGVLAATAAEISEGDQELIEAIDAANCECPRLALKEAIANRLSRQELLDACYVVRYSDSLSGGALISWIRNGGWPVARIRTANEIRNSRQLRAEQIRIAVREDAERAKVPPSQQMVAAVCAERLTNNSLHELVTAEERSALARLQARREAANEDR